MNWQILTCSSVMFAVFGALAIQLLSLVEMGKVPKTERPKMKDPYYWLPFVIGPILGGGLAIAYIYPTGVLEPLVAINVGVSAPLILQSMARTIPDRGGIRVSPDA